MNNLLDRLHQKILNNDRLMKEVTESELLALVEAKEKQIPTKPLFGTVHRDTTYHCGNCKKFVGFYDTRIYQYCHNCGQAIDWSVKE